jgi:hypothetical protein
MLVNQAAGPRVHGPEINPGVPAAPYRDTPQDRDRDAHKHPDQTIAAQFPYAWHLVSF